MIPTYPLKGTLPAKIMFSFGHWQKYISKYPAGEMIPVNLELVNELWLPNIFIYNLKTFKVGLLIILC